MDKRKSNSSFMKMVLLLAFIQITVYTIWQMVVFTITGLEASTLTQWFFTLWGIEVGLLMLKKILENKTGRGGDTDGNAKQCPEGCQESDWSC